MELIHLSLDGVRWRAVVNVVMNIGEVIDEVETISPSRSNLLHTVTSEDDWTSSTSGCKE